MKASTHYKIVGIIFLLGVGSLISGALYGHFCTDKILAREQYLADAAHRITPAENVVKMREYPSRKGFQMSYFVKYQYEKPVGDVMEHYAVALMEHGYVVEKTRRNRLKAKKKDIVVEVEVDQSQKMVYVIFEIDDIFRKLNI